jgi:hypothetical protein
MGDESQWEMGGGDVGRRGQNQTVRDTEGVSCAASPSCFRPPPLVPGLFWFRARVILLPDGPTPANGTPVSQQPKLPNETALPQHPTRPIPRLLVRGRVPTFPPPEPPLLLVIRVFSACCWGRSPPEYLYLLG